MNAARRCFSESLFLAVLIAGVTRTAFAHSFPAVESPSAGQTMAAPPPQVSIKFDAPIEHLFADIQVLSVAGKNEALGTPEVSDDGYTLSIRLSDLRPGAYKVQWAVVCIDTHHTNGSYEFTIAGSGA